jgi:hypothetical protein
MIYNGMMCSLILATHAKKKIKRDEVVRRYCRPFVCLSVLPNDGNLTTK